jgi:hypothetical protein
MDKNKVVGFIIGGVNKRLVVICEDCVKLLAEQYGAQENALTHKPICVGNILPYRQSCRICSAALVNGRVNTELYD